MFTHASNKEMEAHKFCPKQEKEDKIPTSQNTGYTRVRMNIWIHLFCFLIALQLC